MSKAKDDASGGSQGGFSGFMDGLKDKLNDTKLHDAKVQLIHKKSVLPVSLIPMNRLGTDAPTPQTPDWQAGQLGEHLFRRWLWLPT